MPLLYGDSSPSTLEIDYIDYLRRALALAVEILLGEDQLIDAVRRRRALQARVSELSGRLDALRVTARRSVGDVARSPVDDPVTHCANHIESAVDEAVARAVAEVQAHESTAAAEIGRHERKAHAACVTAVEGFLRRHDLPGAVVDIELTHAEAGSGYAAVLRETAPYEVDAEIELDIDRSPFAAPEVRVGGLARDVEVQVPESGGWLRKETRLTSAKLDKLLVVRARRGASELAVELRAGRDARAEGLDLAVDRTSGQVRLTRIGREGSEAIEHSIDNDRALAPLVTAIDGALDDLAGYRARLRGIRVDDAPLEEQEHPSILVDRVLGAMGPEVRRIAERSITPGELILRRQLGDGRREEIFVTQAALAEIVAQLPIARRRHFEVLGIAALGGGRAPTGEVDAGMIVEAAEVSGPSIAIEYEAEQAPDDEDGADKPSAT